MKVLITCGPTWVALDDVRVISNRSTGEMGHLIAEHFLKKKAQVTIIEGPVTHPMVLVGVKRIKYCFFHELAELLEKECRKNYDVIIHAAAISDFMPKQAFKGKKSSESTWLLELLKTPKLINKIKEWSPKALLVAFKLELGMTKKNVKLITRDLFVKSRADLVVVNSNRGAYQGYVLAANGEILLSAKSKKDIAKYLARILS